MEDNDDEQHLEAITHSEGHADDQAVKHHPKLEDGHADDLRCSCRVELVRLVVGFDVDCARAVYHRAILSGILICGGVVMVMVMVLVLLLGVRVFESVGCWRGVCR